MRPRDKVRGMELDAKLVKYDFDVRSLIGIRRPHFRAVLVEQIIESVRRIEFAHLIRDDNNIDPRRADPNDDLFDPLRAAVFRMRRGEFDEAFWLIFLSVHFGKHAKDGWRLARDIYGGLGGKRWTWARVSVDPNGFRAWLTANEKNLESDGISRRFSNHRKYESLRGSSAVGTGAARK